MDSMSPNTHILQALDLSRELEALSDSGILCCEDDGCLLLNGLIRECAHKIRRSAEKEKEIHIIQGKWTFGLSGEAGGQV